MSDAYFLLQQDDPRYPVSLRDLSDAPPLWCWGDPAALSRLPQVSVIGTRTPSVYATRIVPLLLKPLIRTGVGVVSGLAYGIDIAAHQVAIQYGGWGVAVLGGGFDALYPSTHRRYVEALIAGGGCVVSEYSPDTGPRPHFFPARNRLIAALSPLTLVVEAAHASGTMHTVRAALSLQRQVAAVPGPIDTLSSAGTNQLIKDGAQVITCAEDLAQLLAVSLQEMVVSLPDHPDATPLYEAIPSTGISNDSLAHTLQWPLGRVLQGITVLELHGTLINRHGLWHRN